MTFQQLFQIIKQTFLIFCLKYHMKKTFSIVLENDRKTTLKVKQADCRRHYGLKIPYPLPQYLYPCSLCRKCHPQRVTLWAKILLIFKTFTIYPCSLSPNSCTRDKKKISYQNINLQRRQPFTSSFTLATVVLSSSLQIGLRSCVV